MPSSSRLKDSNRHCALSRIAVPARGARASIRQLQIFDSTLGDLNEFGNWLTWVGRTGPRPVIGSCYVMADPHTALDRVEAGRQFGKIAIDIDES